MGVGRTFLLALLKLPSSQLHISRSLTLSLTLPLPPSLSDLLSLTSYGRFSLTPPHVSLRRFQPFTMPRELLLAVLLTHTAKRKPAGSPSSSTKKKRQPKKAKVDDDVSE
jgi:hypothetical protein